MALTKIPSELSSTTGIVDNSNATAITIDSNENVGIGTSSPSKSLHVVGDVLIQDPSPTIEFKDTDNNYIAEISGASGSLLLKADTGGGTSGESMQFHTGGSERMRIDSSGNVGIGGGTISSKLFINTDTVGDSYFRGGADNSRQLDFSTFATASPNAGHKINATSVNGQIAFATGGTERARIDSSGNLNIGTTGDVTSTNAGVQLRADNTIRVAKSGLAAMSIYRHTNNGSIISFYRDATNVGSISVTSSSTSYNTSSDYRLKENVVELTGATERLKQLNPTRFNFIADADTTVDGFLAHEVADVVPEAISGEKDAVDADGNPEYQGIDQSKLVPLLVETIQELEARITELENN